MFWFSLVCRPFASSSSLVLLLQSFPEIFPIYIVYVLYALIICRFASRAWHVYGVFRYFSQALRIKTMANCTRPTLTFWRAHPFLPAHYRNYTICHINIYIDIYIRPGHTAHIYLIIKCNAAQGLRDDFSLDSFHDCFLKKHFSIFANISHYWVLFSVFSKCQMSLSCRQKR